MENSDIELGMDAIEVERKPRAGVVISARFSAEEADLIQGLAERRRVSLSQVVRDAVAAYLVYGASPVTIATRWTGTTSNFGNLTLNYPTLGPSSETEGQAREGERQTITGKELAFSS